MLKVVLLLLLIDVSSCFSRPTLSAFARNGSAPGVTRTPGQRFRKPLLYPPELRGQESARYGRECPAFNSRPESTSEVSVLEVSREP
jgi:hypothetical protein